MKLNSEQLTIIDSILEDHEFFLFLQNQSLL